jgi:GntR family transcriptional regulator
MRLYISPGDRVPIYLQIVNQVKYLVASGRLEAGDEMPSIRALAEQLVINPNTVARAYRELEAQGAVEKRRASGTFVSASRSPLARAQQERILDERLDALLSDARQMDFSTEEVIERLQRRAAEFKDSPKDEQT